MVDAVLVAAGLPKLGAQLRRQTDDFFARLRRRQVTPYLSNAKETTALLRSIVGSSCWSNTFELLRLIRVVGGHLTSADPLQLSVGNCVRRVLLAIRQEFAATAAGRDEMRPAEDKDRKGASLTNLLLADDGGDLMDYTQPYNVKGPIIERIKELLDEHDVLYTNVCEQAVNHIHADEAIMTLGDSDLVEKFLLEVAGGKHKRQFEVFVAEAAPGCTGHEMAKRLSDAKIKTTLIPDCGIFALMARVDKVIIGTHGTLIVTTPPCFAASRIASLRRAPQWLGSSKCSVSQPSWRTEGCSASLAVMDWR